MKLLIASAVLAASTAAVYAGTGISVVPNQVPEISAVTGFAALGIVGAAAALIWERRR